MNTKEILEQLPVGTLVKEPMMRHTTFRIGGEADFFAAPSDEADICSVIQTCRNLSLPYTVIGNGSNLLVSDAGYRGLVLQLYRNFSKISMEPQPDGSVQITAQAGALLSQIAKQAMEAGLTGFEFAGGIPGTLGGAVVMNAGAYGGELADVLTKALVLTRDGEIRTVTAADLDLSYRHSSVPENDWIVLSATLILKPGDSAAIRARMEELKKSRKEKQPLELPSAGSTFKRPQGYFAGKLIQDAGLRGFAVGGAQVSEKHCGFVVNKGGATAADVRTLIGQVQEKVYAQFGVMLEPEIKLLGEF